MTQNGLLAFARQVHFVEDRATALERAVDAVQGATGAAWVAAYTRDDSGTFTRSAAAGDVPFGSPDAVDADDQAIVMLRSERGAIDGPEESVLAGTLVLPFLTAGGITGLLAAGPALHSYTLAERERLFAVANAVGIALELQQLRALRKELAVWRERAEWAERELAVLHRVLDYPAPGSDAAGGSLAGNDSATASS
jgi:hypothetical protein